MSDDRQTWLLHAPVATSIADADARVPHRAWVLVPGGDLDADGAATS